MLQNNNNNNNNNESEEQINAVPMNFLFIKKKSQICHSFHKNIKLKLKYYFLTLIIIIHVYWAPDQYMRMISEGLCDTEDWSNDAENSDLHHINKLLFNIY